jgi:squalene-associated FAD-dependent desaturase
VVTDVTPTGKDIAVVGAGWAGLAAAVQAIALGHRVTLYDMAAHAGGRARSVAVPHTAELDNGQHIMIGAYRETLRVMQLVGVDMRRVFDRRPLELVYPDGNGLRMPSGPARFVFAWAVLRARGWSWRDRWALLEQALVWQRAGMRNPGVNTVDELCQRLPARVRDDLIDPLCIAALNTPASQASATVFLRVLNDALFAAPGGSDLLLPRAGLSQLFPAPALNWLEAKGATRRFAHRVQTIGREFSGYSVDGDAFDAVILACSAVEAARLAAPFNSEWALQAAALNYEPIGTVYLKRGPRRLPRPMLSLRSTPARPAQFAFDLGILGQHAEVVAFVVSGARPWLERGSDAMTQAVQQQAADALPQSFGTAPPVVHTAMERRATFACTPDLLRPAMRIADGLLAAGDYVEGPYPATLEGSVRAAVRAVRALGEPMTA